MASTSEDLSQTQGQTMPRSLPILDAANSHTFVKPMKRIHEGHDVPAFLTSRAYRDIGVFVMQLNLAMCPRKSPEAAQIQTWRLDSPIVLSEPVQKLRELLQNIDSIIEEAPPDTGPRRFGNVSFRKWYEILESRIETLLEKYLPNEILEFSTTGNGVSVLDELIPYLLGGFGSPQRLDYGTGHELSFLAFLGCIWKLGGFSERPSSDGALERSIVIGLVEPYLRVARHLILTYTLEPAGSHGVWGLDDHSALPYIFGSAQCCPAINDDDPMPVEGSLPGAPDPGDIAKKNIVEKERKHNMYFSAVGFINDVKTGPFWEHSPMLFDISGVRTGWGKINKGMVKMYNGEVLSKFPVVQHFPFGSLFSWEQDPSATAVSKSIHTASQPQSHSTQTSRPPPDTTKSHWAQPPSGRNGESTAAPWAKSGPSQGTDGPTRAPWAQPPRGRVGESTAAPWAAPATAQSVDGQTRAPWQTGSGGAIPPTSREPQTKAPWADSKAPGRA